MGLYNTRSHLSLSGIYLRSGKPALSLHSAVLDLLFSKSARLLVGTFPNLTLPFKLLRRRSFALFFALLGYFHWGYLTGCQLSLRFTNVDHRLELIVDLPKSTLASLIPAFGTSAHSRTLSH